VPGVSGGVTDTIVPDTTSATMPSPFASTASTDNAPPSGSESLSSTRTVMEPPGRIVTASATAIGLRDPSARVEMPTRTVPVARAPNPSTTVYVKLSVPAELAFAWYST
jgi:hypothetical protein